jgi:serine/threonine protein kinase
MNDYLPSSFEREIRITQQFCHPNIACLVDLVKDDSNYYVFFELCSGGSLLRLITEKQRLSEDEARVIFRQLLAAISYVHSAGFAHRDVNPENIIFDDKFNVKLAGFGFTKFLAHGELTSTACGSPGYAAPELFSHKSYNGMPADMWSVGAILFHMVAGQLPWPARNKVRRIKAIRQAKYEFPLALSDLCKDLITNLMTLVPANRLTVEQALGHPWVSSDHGFQMLVATSRHVALRSVDEFFGLGDLDFQTPVLPRRPSTSELSDSFTKAGRYIAPQRVCALPRAFARERSLLGPMLRRSARRYTGPEEANTARGPYDQRRNVPFLLSPSPVCVPAVNPRVPLI